MRQDLVATGHHGDLDAEFGIGVAELRAGDTGADDDQMLGQLGEVVELAPVQDALTVGFGTGQHSRPGAGGDQDDVGLQHADLAVECGDFHSVMRHARRAVDQFTAPRDDIDARVQQLAADIGGLRPGQRLDPAVDLLERYLGVLDRDVEAEAVGAAKLGAHARRRDQCLRGHAVPEHAGPADAVAVDDGDLGDVATAGGGDQCRLIACGPAADDHDAGCHAH